MSNEPITAFLKHVLGEDGQRAFERANSRIPMLEGALGPRTILSWLTTSVRVNYEGEIPGLNNSYISLEKSDQGFNGALTIGDDVHSFDNADILHVAAAVAVALGVEDAAINPLVKNTDISKLGKSIDLLVKARVIASAQIAKLVEESSSAEESEVEKQEMPGGAAVPKKPKEPEGPQAPQAVAPSTNANAKPPMAKKELVVKKSDTEYECSECGMKQFRAGRFTGCMCVRALAKNVKTIDAGDSYRLQISGLNPDDLQALFGAFNV